MDNPLANLPAFSRFADVGDTSLYRALPDDWVLGLTDVVGSTEAIHRGHYKAVNIAGAAAISAVMNVLGTRHFPFAFAGDGCAFALPGAVSASAREALAKTAAWVRDDLNLKLRAAMVDVAAIRAAGRDLRVAMFRPSEHVAYAMFDGGGLAWAERAMKAGALAVSAADPGERPDLSGLSCRWRALRTRNGAILSVIVRPTDGSSREAFGSAVRDLIALLGDPPRTHPVPARGPDAALLSPGMRLEALASRGRRSLAGRMLGVGLHNLMGWLFFRTGIRAGTFDPAVYRALAGANADTRKFSDGLALTLDCEPGLEEVLGTLLKEQAAAGRIVYGIHRQDAALMTCIVPSYQDHGHFHFVDGAGGGYAAAALALERTFGDRTL